MPGQDHVSVLPRDPSMPEPFMDSEERAPVDRQRTSRDRPAGTLPFEMTLIDSMSLFTILRNDSAQIMLSV